MSSLSALSSTTNRANFVLITLLLGMLSFSVHSSAQRQDFRTWWSADFSKDFTGDLGMSVELEQRFRYNSLRYDRSLITAAVAYEVLKDLELEGGYRFLVVRDDPGILETRYRLHGDLSYDYGVDDFSFKLRGRLQYGFNDLNSVDEYYENKLTNRNKFTAEYDVFGWPVSLFASYELFVALEAYSPVSLSDHRFETGIEYMISFKSSLELSYMVDNEINQSNPLQAHVMTVSYSLKL
ncbi:MAG: DUF2490 domain-containing protein [Bacteroidales bacterium]|nr:DUF2490 domain-containing protein [Bacteroidales bacterium]